MKRDNYRKHLKLSVFCFAVSACSVLLIRVSSFGEDPVLKALAYLVGILFWGGLISGLIITARLSRSRPAGFSPSDKRPGVLRFFSSKEAKICDTVFIVFVILFLISRTIAGFDHPITLILLCAALFSGYLHSILNGKNYAYAAQRGVQK